MPNSDEILNNKRHSLAHLLASAVLEQFPDAQLGVGPVIETGFYYDFLLPRALTPEDLPKLEKRMKELAKSKLDFERQEMTAGEAKKIFETKNQPFKVELISDIEKFGTTKADQILNSDDSLAKSDPINEKNPTVSLYKTGEFIDLCRGGHVENTGEISEGSFKLHKISGAYWRGDQEKPQLQRVYGLAFENKEDLEKYLELLEEAEKRDHKKLGPLLELFMFHPTAPGMPYWLPKGMVVMNELIDFWRREHKKRDYQEISAPLVNKKELWETSGHWDHYQENMFIAQRDENEVYGVKAMNCPNAMLVFDSKSRSYRDLPLRLSDTDTLHRYELAGALNGLFRVRSFRQDDSHNFITENQIEEEYERIFEITERFYGIFNLSYKFRLGTRPDSFLGDIETWDKAEDALKRILDKSGKEYYIEEGDGAFYGPKVDILMKDVLGREWQMGTIQLDFQQPRQFNLEYTAADGSRQRPVAIHRVIYGSLERFIGILIEHYAGAFPLWISPVQIKIIPIADRHIEQAEKTKQKLLSLNENLRIEIDDRAESIGKKIRDANGEKIPYMAVIGDKEMESESVAVRGRAELDLGTITIEQFADHLKQEIEEKK